jgi:drug/metabolite transporter (DMT)-like permease
MIRAERQPMVVAAAALTVAVWSSAFIAIRYLRHPFGPGEIALGRLLVGSVALGALMVIRRERLPPRNALLGIAVCGVLWFGVYNVALNAAERHVDAGIAALLVNVGPIFIAILAGAVLKEGFPRLLLLGCIVAFAGAALIGVAGARHHVGAGWGIALCLIAALSYAVGVIAQKPALAHASALSVTWLACTIGAVLCVPYTPGLVHELGHATAGQTLWVVYLGIFPTTIGFLAWGYALSHTTAGRMGSLTYLVPPLALILGWPILSETPPLLAIPGGILCIAGVALARRQPARAQAPAPVPAPGLVTAPRPSRQTP